MFNSAILDEVSQRFILFLSDAEPEDFAEHRKLTLQLQHQKSEEFDGAPSMTEEVKSIDEAEVQLGKMLEQSRCLILQFFTKLIQDSTFPTNVRVFFVKNQVFNKIADLRRFNSRQINIEIIKFFKAIIASKDR